MKEDNRTSEMPRSRITIVTGELRNFSDASRGQEQQRQPRATSHEPCRVLINPPRSACHDKNRERSEAPGTIEPAPAEGLREHDDGRDARDKKQDVVKID